MKRKRFHVTKRGIKWLVLQEGDKSPIVETKTQAQAIRKGRALAKAAKGQLLIHRRDGRIREERTYGGGDPHPPRG